MLASISLLHSTVNLSLAPTRLKWYYRKLFLRCYLLNKLIFAVTLPLCAMNRIGRRKIFKTSIQLMTKYHTDKVEVGFLSFCKRLFFLITEHSVFCPKCLYSITPDSCIFGWLVLWYIKHCRLFNAKSIVIEIVSSISNNSVKFQVIQFSTSTDFD